MDNNENKISKKNLIFMIFTIVAVLMAGTFAWLSYRTQDTAMVLTVGDIENVRVVLSPYQINSSIGSVTSYTSGAVTNVEAVNNNTSSKKFKLYYKVDSIDSNLAITSFKYTITRSTSKNGTYSKYGSDGNFSGVKSGDSVVILEENLSAGQTYYYKVYLWLDGSGNVSSAQGKSFVGELRAEIISLSDQYQQVEYIESTGTQYILTDVIPSANFKLEASVYAVSGSGSQPSFAGVADTKSIQYYYDSSGKPKVWTNAGSVGSSTAYYGQTINYIAETNSSGMTLNVNGTKFTSSYVYPGATTRYLMLFAYNASSGPAYYFSGRIYNLKLYDNNVLIRSFVPCYDKYNLLSTGKYDAGLCDIVNNKFYGNNGTGYFNYGNNV